MTDPLQCTYEDARRQHLRDGIAMSTAAKVGWFEEMVALAVKVGAVDRLREADEGGALCGVPCGPVIGNEPDTVLTDQERSDDSDR